MGRAPKLTMKVLDVVAEDTRCTISVQIKHGKDSWNKGFTIPAEALSAFTMNDLKKRVLEEAKSLIRKKQLKDQAVNALEGLVDHEITLSQTSVQDPA